MRVTEMAFRVGVKGPAQAHKSVSAVLTVAFIFANLPKKQRTRQLNVSLLVKPWLWLFSCLCPPSYSKAKTRLIERFNRHFVRAVFNLPKGIGSVKRKAAQSA